MNLVDGLAEVGRYLTAWGVQHVFTKDWDRWDGPLNPNRRHCQALGGVEHWTASPNTATSYLITGRPGLPLLANVQLHRDGLVRILSGFYANHAGYTNVRASTDVLYGLAPMDRDIKPGADSTVYSLNGRAIGLEGNAGPGSPYTPEMHTSATAFWAACTLTFGWSREVPHVGAHAETTTRKPGDPSHPLYQRRRDVAALIRTKTTTTQEDIMNAAQEAKLDRLSQDTARALQILSTLDALMSPADPNRLANVHDVDALTKRVTELEGKLAAIQAGTGDPAAVAAQLQIVAKEA